MKIFVLLLFGLLSLDAEGALRQGSAQQQRQEEKGEQQKNVDIVSSNHSKATELEDHKKNATDTQRNLRDETASASPSVSSGSAPSIGPAAAPEASALPTADQNTAPTIGPFVAPPEASEFSSSEPSTAPSSWPTAAPSGFSSSEPSTAPSSWPTAAPSGFPSSETSSTPSSWPTAAPSGFPSSETSTATSSWPTAAPSGPPSPAPSTIPSSSVDSQQVTILEIPDVSSSDVAKVMDWIKLELTRDETPFCWRDSYGRGVGLIPVACPSGKELIGGLCYSKCPSGYARFGLDCHSVCPSGFRDDGLFCRHAEYGRGGGYPWHFFELNNHGMLSRCRKHHGSCEMWGAIAYPKCKSGFSPFGCCICRPTSLPNCGALGLNDAFDLSCAKRIVIGDPTIPICSQNLEYDTGLCYTPCKFGFHGVGPVCWSECGSGQVDCGAACGRSSEDCATEIVGQILGPLILAANVVTMGLATPATNALQTITVGGKVVAGTTRLGKAFVTIVRQLQTIEKLEDAASGAMVLRKVTDPRTGKILSENLTRLEIRLEAFEALEDWKQQFADDFASQTSTEINAAINSHFEPHTAQYMKQQWGMVEMEHMAESNNWNTAGLALLAASVFDPTGVTDVIAAFAKPTCLVNKPFPRTAADKTYTGGNIEDVEEKEVDGGGGILAVGTNKQLYVRGTITNEWEHVKDSAYVTDVTVMKDGKILAIGNKELYTRDTLYSNWVHVKSSGSVIGIAVMKDGKIVGVGTNYQLYTRNTLTSRWVYIPDSGDVIGVTVMNDGKILGVGRNYKLYIRDTISSPWVYIPNSGDVINVAVLGDGKLVGVGTNKKLYIRETTSSSWVYIPNSGDVIDVASLIY